MNKIKFKIENGKLYKKWQNGCRVWSSWILVQSVIENEKDN